MNPSLPWSKLPVLKSSITMANAPAAMNGFIHVFSSKNTVAPLPIW